EVPDLEAAEQPVRFRDEVRIYAPDQLDDVLEDEEERVRDQDQHDLVATVAEAEDAALDERPGDEPHGDRCRDEQGVAGERSMPRRKPPTGERRGRVRAERV